jgi:hypothetical protein
MVCAWRWDEVVRVGVPFSLSAVQGIYSRPHRVVADLFARYINSEQQCGFGGLGLPLQVQWREIRSDDAAGVAEATRALLQPRNLSLLMLPDGALAPLAAQVAADAGLALVAGASGVRDLFLSEGPSGAGGPPRRRFANVVGVITPAEAYFASFMPLLRVRGYQRVAVLSSDSQLNTNICDGSISSIADNGMQLVLRRTVPTGNSSTGNSSTLRARMRAALLQAQQLDAQVLLSCFSLNCDTLFRTLHELDYNPLAHGAFECGNVLSKFDADVAVLAQYTFSPVQFDCRLFGQLYADAFDPLFPDDAEDAADGSIAPARVAPPLRFCRAYAAAVAATAGQPAASSVTAAHLAAWYVLNDVVVRANSSAASVLLSHLASTDFVSFFGAVHFDRYGRNSARQMPQRQLVDTLGNTSLVFPFVSSAILPMPTFRERVFAPRYFASPAERAYVASASAASLLCMVLLLFLVRHRSYRAVHALSAPLSALLPLGGLLLCVAPLTWSVYDTALSCALRVPVWVLGYLLLLVPVLVSSRRMARVVGNSQLTTSLLWSTRDVLLQALLLASPQLLIAIAWMIVSPLTPTVVTVDPHRPAWNQIVCRCERGQFVWASLSLLALKLCGCAYYAFRLRRIPARFDMLSNSRHVALLCLLLPTIVAVLLAAESALPEYQVQRDSVPTKFLLRSLLVLFVAVAAQALYFWDCLRAVWHERIAVQSGPASALPVLSPSSAAAALEAAAVSACRVDVSMVRPSLLAPPNSSISLGAGGRMRTRDYEGPVVIHCACMPPDTTLG